MNSAGGRCDDINNETVACDAAYLHCLHLQFCSTDALQDKELRNDG